MIMWVVTLLTDAATARQTSSHVGVHIGASLHCPAAGCSTSMAATWHVNHHTDNKVILDLVTRYSVIYWIHHSCTNPASWPCSHDRLEQALTGRQSL